MIEELLRIFILVLMTSCYLVHLACPSIQKDCPRKLEVDFAYDLPMASFWAKAAVGYINLNKDLIRPVAEIGSYCYCILLGLLIYTLIKYSFDVIKNIIYLALTLLAVYSILHLYNMGHIKTSPI